MTFKSCHGCRDVVFVALRLDLPDVTPNHVKNELVIRQNHQENAFPITRERIIVFKKFFFGTGFLDLDR